MAQNDYRPVSWNGESISNAKLNQMANNTQFIFERQPKMRYTGAGNNIIRDTALKVLSGKTPFPPVTTANWIYQNIYFGSFFTVNCKPIITASLEAGDHRGRVVIRSFGAQGTEIDHVGFIAIVSHESAATLSPGWVHWTAVGY